MIQIFLRNVEIFRVPECGSNFFYFSLAPGAPSCSTPVYAPKYFEPLFCGSEKSRKISLLRRTVLGSSRGPCYQRDPNPRNFLLIGCLLFKLSAYKMGVSMRSFKLQVLSLFKLPFSISGENRSLNEHLRATFGLK